MTGDLHLRDPDEVRDYLERFSRAQSILGAAVEPPPAGLAAQVIEEAARMGIGVSFDRVLDDDEGELVWEMTMATSRGVMVERPEVNESWVDVMLRTGLVKRA